MSERVNRAQGLSIALAMLLACTGGCSVRRWAVAGLADTFSGDAAGVFASDDDPELIRAALPFSLKTMEALLVEVPDDQQLLRGTCAAFTQYAYAYPAADAELAETESFAEAESLRLRARRLFLRGRDYCLRALELRLPGVREQLLREPGTALSGTTREDVPLLYWTGASWGSALSLGLDQPGLVADLPAVRALFDRALALDEAWNHGAIHGALIPLDALPAIMGGSPERAHADFERAVALSGGASAGPYVSYAQSVAKPAGDRTAFVELMESALAVDLDDDPGQRLANEIAQRRARHGLAHSSDWFVSEPDAETPR